jgi:hypothetical protein
MENSDPDGKPDLEPLDITQMQYPTLVGQSIKVTILKSINNKTLS